MDLGQKSKTCFDTKQWPLNAVAGKIDQPGWKGVNAGEKSLNFTNLLSSWYVLGTAMGLPGGSDGKEFACNAGDLGLISGLGRFPGEGNNYPL